MPYFLRALYSNIKWEKTQYSSWLKEDELPSCVIRDLRADDNSLSLWEIDDDKSNLLNVVSALAAQRKSIKNDFDYALLESHILDEVSFNPTKKSGITPYTSINTFHRDVPNLSINNVVYFAYLLSKHGIFDRMGWRDALKIS
ncbi:MAG: hypothetical protein JW712_00240 [Dehalococcoidales bacterium]|nr:hypothetical protein [Dehalococcoidales bacterium]